MPTFQAEIQRLEQWGDCTLGFSAIHLPSARSLGYHDNRPFQLCSTYKLPIVVCLLKKVEKGELSLDHLCTISESDLCPGIVSTLNQLQYSTPVTLSVFNLLQFMLQESCNTASDILLRLIGGPVVVMKFLQELGIDDLRVDRFSLEIIADSDGIDLNKLGHSYTLQRYQELENQLSLEDKKQAREKFKTDPRDKGTPGSMTRLLSLVKSHEILKPENSLLLLNVMQRCKTGEQRIMGLLSPGIRVSHKTGTATGLTNDAGIIYLPGGQGEVVLSVFVEHLEKPRAIGERLIAEVSRNVVDYFLFQS